MARELADLAGWPEPAQRPVHHYAAGLDPLAHTNPASGGKVSGWKRADDYPGSPAGQLMASLAAATAGLTREMEQLWSARRFARQTECLHSPSRGGGGGGGGGSGGGGGWFYFGVLGDGGMSSCPRDTAPAACRWAEAAVAAGGQLHRVGYSVVEPGTWIRSASPPRWASVTPLVPP